MSFHGLDTVLWLCKVFLMAQAEGRGHGTSLYIFVTSCESLSISKLLSKKKIVEQPPS